MLASVIPTISITTFDDVTKVHNYITQDVGESSLGRIARVCPHGLEVISYTESRMKSFRKSKREITMQ